MDAALPMKNLPQELKTGDAVLIDDGKLRLAVCETTETDICCKVVNGGQISNHKGINVPYVALQMAYLSEQDKSDLLFGIEKSMWTSWQPLSCEKQRTCRICAIF